MQASSKGCGMASATAATLSQRIDYMQMFRNPPAGVPVQAVNSSLDLSNDLPADSLKQQQLQKHHHGPHKLSTATRGSSDSNASPGRGGNKPVTARSQQPQYQPPRVLDLRNAGHDSQQWGPDTANNARTHSPAYHIPQRPAWESNVAAVWGKPKPTELKPAGSAGAGGVLDLTGADHTDTSHWCSLPRHSGSSAAAGDLAGPTAATAGHNEHSHWSPGIPKRKSSDGGPQGQQMACTAVTNTAAAAAPAVQASCDAAADAAAPASAAAAVALPGVNGAGVKRQLPLGSLVDAAAAGPAVAGSWWALEQPTTAPAVEAADAGTHQKAARPQVVGAGDQTSEETPVAAAATATAKANISTSAPLAEVPASTFKRLKISGADDDAPSQADSEANMDCGILRQQQQQEVADAVPVAAVGQTDGAQPHKEEDPWAKHQREVQQLKQQQEELQQLLQHAEQHVKVPILREAQLLTMEMQEKVRARGLDSVSLAAMSRDAPCIKRTADSDAERVAAHMLAQEGGNWKASLERLMRMVKASVQQKQLLDLRQGELHPSSSTASPVHSSGEGNTAAAAETAVPEAPVLSQHQQLQQLGSAPKLQEHGTPVAMQWQRSMQEASPYAAAAGGTAQLQASPYAAAVDSAHNSPAVRQYSTAGTLGQSATASPYAGGSYAAAAGATLQRSGSPYTAGPVGLAGVPQPAAVTAAKLQWPMVPTSAVGSPVGSPACSPMVPTSAVGSPLTASADVNGNTTGSGGTAAAAGAVGGFSKLILPAPVWGGGTPAVAAASTAAGAAGGPVRYGSPMPSMQEGIASANSSPVGPAAAAGARGRSHSPAGTCGRPKLVRQQSRMAPKQPQNKASVAAMTGGYQASIDGGVGTAGGVPGMLGMDGYSTLAPAGAAGYMPGAVDASLYAASAAASTAPVHMQGAACNEAHSAGAGAAGAAVNDTAAGTAPANVPGLFDSSAYAAGMMCAGSLDAAAAAAMAVPDSHHGACGASASGNTGAAGAGAIPASCSSDAQFAEGGLNHAPDAAVYAQQPGIASWNATGTDVESSSLQAAQNPTAATLAGNVTAADSNQAAVPGDPGQQQQHLTTAAAAAAAFGSVTALTVDTDIEDAAWLFGEGGLLPDTPGPANLLPAQQQQQQRQQQQGKMYAATHLQQQQHHQQDSASMLAVMAPAANSSAAAAAQPADMEVDRAEAAAVAMPPPAAAAVATSGIAIGAESKPLGTDKDDIALLQMLLGWGNDS